MCSPPEAAASLIRLGTLGDGLRHTSLRMTGFNMTQYAIFDLICQLPPCSPKGSGCTPLLFGVYSKPHPVRHASMHFTSAGDVNGLSGEIVSLPGQKKHVLHHILDSRELPQRNFCRNNRFYCLWNSGFQRQFFVTVVVCFISSDGIMNQQRAFLFHRAPSCMTDDQFPGEDAASASPQTANLPCFSHAGSQPADAALPLPSDAERLNLSDTSPS